MRQTRTVITIAGETKLVLRPGVDATPLLDLLRGAQLVRDHRADDGTLIVEARQPSPMIIVDTSVREQDLVEDPPAGWPWPKERSA